MNNNLVKAQDIMTQQVLSAKVNQPFKDLIKVFVNMGLHHIPIVNDDNTIRAIVSSNDALAALHQLDTIIAHMEGMSLERRLTVRNEMSTEVVTAAPDTSVEELAQLMIRKKINSVLIVDEEKLVGIVTSTDLLKTIYSA